jgi:regulator of replication initiation timing
VNYHCNRCQDRTVVGGFLPAPCPQCRRDAADCEYCGARDNYREREALTAQLARVEAERDEARQTIAAMKDVTPDDVANVVDENNQLEAENTRLRKTISDALAKWEKDAKAVVSSASCSWCDERWLQTAGMPSEEARRIARDHAYRCTRHPLKIERDSALADLAACRAERDDIRRTLEDLSDDGVEYEHDLIANIERDTAEAIAVWLESPAVDSDYGKEFAADIRAGSWRSKEGK